MGRRSYIPAHFASLAATWPAASSVCAAIAVCAMLFGSSPAHAQIAKVPVDDGRTLFVNAEPPPILKVPSRRTVNVAAAVPHIDLGAAAAKVELGSRTPEPNIYLPPEASLTGGSRPSLNLDRDGVEKLVQEAAERHGVNPALIRAVIETESNFNSRAVSRKGAVGLMQLIPTTAHRFGVNDLYSPQQNVDAGVKYLKTLLERYNGNLDLALAAYNAGEGAVDRAHGVPSFRETRNYVQKVQLAYGRSSSGAGDGLFIRSHAIRKISDAKGRTIFTNE